MRNTTILLLTILGLGILISIGKLNSGNGGSGLDGFVFTLSWTSITLFITSLVILLKNVRQIRSHKVTFLFLLLGLPFTIEVSINFVESIYYNRTPDLIPKYKRPISCSFYLKDSSQITAHLNSIVSIKNKRNINTIVISTFIDTIMYSQTGKEIFVVYIKQLSSNELSNYYEPAYLSSKEKDSIGWHLEESVPNDEYMNSSFQNVDDLKKEVRKFYFNQFSFKEKDSLKYNYFWHRTSKLYSK